MEQRSEVGQALNKLQAVREQNSRLALMSKPVAVKKGGFLGWLQKLALTNRWCHTLWRELAPA
jgi:membrane glycosyltransferase